MASAVGGRIGRYDPSSHLACTDLTRRTSSSERPTIFADTCPEEPFLVNLKKAFVEPSTTPVEDNASKITLASDETRSSSDANVIFEALSSTGVVLEDHI